MKDWFEELPQRGKNIFKYYHLLEWDLNNDHVRVWYYEHRRQMFNLGNFGPKTDRGIRQVIQKHWPKHWKELEINSGLYRKDREKNHRDQRLKHAQTALEILLNNINSGEQKSINAIASGIEVALELIKPRNY